jgi:hypothetical protein
VQDRVARLGAEMHAIADLLTGAPASREIMRDFTIPD